MRLFATRHGGTPSDAAGHRPRLDQAFISRSRRTRHRQATGSRQVFTGIVAGRPFTGSRWNRPRMVERGSSCAYYPSPGPSSQVPSSSPTVRSVNRRRNQLNQAAGSIDFGGSAGRATGPFDCSACNPQAREEDLKSFLVGQRACPVREAAGSPPPPPSMDRRCSSRSPSAVLPLLRRVPVSGAERRGPATLRKVK